MSSHRFDPRTAALVALGGVAFIVMAVVQATHPTFDDQLTTTIDYVNDGSFALALLLTIPGLLALAGPTAPTRLAVAGQALIVAGVVPALATGESPSWFAAVGVPGVLATLVGTVWLGVRAWRSASLPRPAAVALALTVPAGIIAADVGAAVVPGIFWLWLGARLVATRPARAVVA
jgi:hypothetical protein